MLVGGSSTVSHQAIRALHQLGMFSIAYTQEAESLGQRICVFIILIGDVTLPSLEVRPALFESYFATPISIQYVVFFNLVPSVG